jgi:protein kinase A
LVKYEIPKHVDDLADILIQKLLVRRQATRLGNLSKGYLDVKNHLWFEKSSVNFKALLKKEMDAPWKPEVKNPLDSSNFDDFSSIEKEKDTGRRLTREEQNVFKGF